MLDRIQSLCKLPSTIELALRMRFSCRTMISFSFSDITSSHKVEPPSMKQITTNDPSVTAADTVSPQYNFLDSNSGEISAR